MDEGTEPGGTGRVVLDPGALAGDETILVLASRPGDETVFCGGLIAECCRRGRPPVVAVLTDGVAPGDAAAGEGTGERHVRQVRRAVQCLRLPAENLHILGLLGGSVPLGGAFYDAIVAAITFLMWRRDCNIICAPGMTPGATSGGDPDRRAAGAIARSVARGSGVALLTYPPSADDARFASTALLDVGRHGAGKERAMACFDGLDLKLLPRRPDVEAFAREVPA